MAALSVTSPAKLNLFLHIVGRRPDGRHDLQTVFQLLDWGDTLCFEADHSGAITLAGDALGIAPRDNLILRAATLLDGASRGARIHVRKRIPLGGGLGGGSSNAATTLLVLNQLWQCGYTAQELMQLGSALGADVPVFVAGHSAWAEGTGDRLTPLALAPRWYLVVAPGVHVSTARIFSHRQLTRNSRPIKMAAFFQGHSRNDCQPLVRKLYPEVDKLMTELGNYGAARLTGTGGCAFVAFDSAARAEAAREELPRTWQGFVARGANTSPVLRALA